jgi:hypothetical protein
MKKNTTFFERILQLIDFYDIKNINIFAKNYLGYASSEKINRLKRENTNPSYDIIVDIANKFEQVSVDWLLTGKGDMLRGDSNVDVRQSETVNDTILIDRITQQAEQIGILKAENSHKNEQIRKLSSENERLKNELEKLQPKRKELQDSIIEHDSQIFDMSKLSPLSAPLAAEPPATYRWRPENDINAEQNIPKI